MPEEEINSDEYDSKEELIALIDSIEDENKIKYLLGFVTLMQVKWKSQRS